MKPVIKENSRAGTEIDSQRTCSETWELMELPSMSDKRDIRRAGDVRMVFSRLGNAATVNIDGVIERRYHIAGKSWAWLTADCVSGWLARYMKERNLVIDPGRSENHEKTAKPSQFILVDIPGEGDGHKSIEYRAFNIVSSTIATMNHLNRGIVVAVLRWCIKYCENHGLDLRVIFDEEYNEHRILGGFETKAGE